MIPSFLGAAFRNILQIKYDSKLRKQGILGNHRWRVVSPRETWYPHKQELAAGSLAAEPNTACIITLPHTSLEPTLLAPGPNPSSHRHPRRTSLRHVRRLHPVTREEAGTY